MSHYLINALTETKARFSLPLSHLTEIFTVEYQSHYLEIGHNAFVDLSTSEVFSRNLPPAKSSLWQASPTAWWHVLSFDVDDGSLLDHYTYRVFPEQVLELCENQELINEPNWKLISSLSGRPIVGAERQPVDRDQLVENYIMVMLDRLSGFYNQATESLKKQNAPAGFPLRELETTESAIRRHSMVLPLSGFLEPLAQVKSSLQKLSKACQAVRRTTAKANEAESQLWIDDCLDEQLRLSETERHSFDQRLSEFKISVDGFAETVRKTLSTPAGHNGGSLPETEDGDAKNGATTSIRTLTALQLLKLLQMAVGTPGQESCLITKDQFESLLKAVEFPDTRSDQETDLGFTLADDSNDRAKAACYVLRHFRASEKQIAHVIEICVGIHATISEKENGYRRWFTRTKKWAVEMSLFWADRASGKTAENGLLSAWIEKSNS